MRRSQLAAQRLSESLGVRASSSPTLASIALPQTMPALLRLVEFSHQGSSAPAQPSILNFPEFLVPFVGEPPLPPRLSFALQANPQLV